MGVNKRLYEEKCGLIKKRTKKGTPPNKPDPWGKRMSDQYRDKYNEGRKKIKKSRRKKKKPDRYAGKPPKINCRCRDCGWRTKRSNYTFHLAASSRCIKCGGLLDRIFKPKPEPEKTTVWETPSPALLTSLPESSIIQQKTEGYANPIKIVKEGNQDAEEDPF